MAISLVFAQPRRLCGTAEMADLIRLRPGRARTRPGQPHLFTSYVQATHAVDPVGSLTDSLRRTGPIREVLDELLEATGYTVCMGALDYRRVRYLHRLYAPGQAQRFINQELRISLSAPLYCTALGKALLASLSEPWQRRLLSQVNFIPQGPRSCVAVNELLAELATLDYREPVVSNEEFVVGARSIAMCVKRPRDEQPVAIDVTVPADDFRVRELREQIGPSVKYAADRIARIEAEGYGRTSHADTRASVACYDTRSPRIHPPTTSDDAAPESAMPPRADIYTDAINPYKIWHMQRAFRLGWDAADQGLSDKQARQQVAAAKLNRMTTAAWWRGFDTQREGAPDTKQAS